MTIKYEYQLLVAKEKPRSNSSHEAWSLQKRIDYVSVLPKKERGSTIFQPTNPSMFISARSYISTRYSDYFIMVTLIQWEESLECWSLCMRLPVLLCTKNEPASTTSKKNGQTTCLLCKAWSRREPDEFMDAFKKKISACTFCLYWKYWEILSNFNNKFNLNCADQKHENNFRRIMICMVQPLCVHHRVYAGGLTCHYSSHSCLTNIICQQNKWKHFMTSPLCHFSIFNWAKILEFRNDPRTIK